MSEERGDHDPFGEMDIHRFEEILEDESDPLHAQALQKRDEIAAPFKRIFENSPLVRQQEMFSTIGKSIGGLDVGVILGGVASPQVGRTTTPAIPKTGEPIEPYYASLSRTVAEVQVDMQEKANELLGLTVDELRAMNEANGAASSDALVVATGARLAAWWAVGVAGVGIVVTVIFGLISVLTPR